jgi:hypothetical protein
MMSAFLGADGPWADRAGTVDLYGRFAGQGRVIFLTDRFLTRS